MFWFFLVLSIYLVFGPGAALIALLAVMVLVKEESD